MSLATTKRTISVNDRLLVFSHAVLFVLGFSIVFVVGWGGAATLLGQMFGMYKSILARVGGVLVILFGLATIGVVRIPWLFYDTRPEWRAQNRKGFLASATMGSFFAAGWAPCIGTTLGAILTLGISRETSGQAMWLSSGYALGLGIPFLLIGLSMDRATNFVRLVRPYLRKIQIGSGIFMIAIGLLMLTNQITMISIWAQRNGWYLDLASSASASPTYLLAFLAGLISFVSPCVLPLVPAYVGYLSGHALNQSTET